MAITQELVRHVIYYEWLRGTGATGTVQNINSTLGEGTTSLSTVKRWFARFEEGDTNFEDKPRSGRPHTVDDIAILDAVKEDPELSTRSLATRLGCTQPTVVGRLHALGYRKVLARWIPHELTENARVTSVSHYSSAPAQGVSCRLGYWRRELDPLQRQ